MSRSATTTQSIKDAKKRLQRFLRTLEAVPQQEVAKSAQRIYAEAIAQTPYDTGKLEDAVYVKVSKAKSRVGINAGASAKSDEGYDYAGIQHEVPFYHPIKGKDHYISDPFNEEVTDLMRRIERRVEF